MESPLAVRFVADVEISSTGDGRTVRGILVPWNQPAVVRDHHGPSGRLEVYTEAIDRGAFPDAVANPGRVKFLAHHQRTQNPLGRAAMLRDDAAGLYGELYVSRTTAGDEVLELINDGVLDAFSVGFVPGASRLDGDIYVRTSATLQEASVVTFPAYAGAQILGTRSEDLNPEGGESADAPGAGEPSEVDRSGDPSGDATRPTGLIPAARTRVLSLLDLGVNP